MKRHQFTAGFTFALIIVTGLASPALSGEPVPFKGDLDGVLTSRTPIEPGVVFDHFDITGNATQFGQFELVIEAVVDFRSLPVMGMGTFTFTAANGDTLVADFTGSSALVAPGLVLITEHAMIDPERSTGRFAGATGTFTSERLADAATGVNGETVGSFAGTISLPVPGQQ